MNLGAFQDCSKLSYTLLMKIILMIVFWKIIDIIKIDLYAAFRCYAPKQATYTKNFFMVLWKERF